MAKAKQTATKQAKPSKVASNSKTIKKAEKAVQMSMEKYCSVTMILQETANITHSITIKND